MRAVYLCGSGLDLDQEKASKDMSTTFTDVRHATPLPKGTCTRMLEWRFLRSLAGLRCRA